MSEQGLSRNLEPSSSADHEDIKPVIAIQLAKRRYWLKVELGIFLSTLGQALSSIVITQLLLVRNCEALFPYNTSKCDLLVYKTETREAQELETLVQPYVTILQMYKSMIEACVPAILSLFVGPWSDYHGRKPLMLWPMLGYGLMYVTYTFLSAVPNLRPHYFLMASIPVALSGGLITIISGVYAYTSDITTPERRAFRMGLLDVSLFSGLVVGAYISAPLFSIAGKYGYVTVFATSATCSLLSFLYMIFIPESIKINETESSSGGFCSLFDRQLVVRMIAICFKRREHYGRAIIFLVIICISTCVISMEGEGAVSFLYTRDRFGWNLSKYTQFGSISTLVSVCGALTGMYVFSVRLKVPDSIFVMGVFLTKCVQTLICGLATKEWYLYVGCAVGVFGGVSGPLCRSIISKTVPQKDIGTVFALTSMVEALTPLAASPLYTFVYNATLLTFPGTFFVVSSAIFFLDVILLSGVVALQRRSPTHNYTEVQEAE